MALCPGEILEFALDGIRYEIVRPLGDGGEAEVFLARRGGPAGFVRDVALKLLRPPLDTHSPVVRSFLQEAQLTARLRHPNIAEAYDLARLGDRYVLVLEFIDGVTARAAP